MNRFFQLAVLTAAVCVLSSVSEAGPVVSSAPKPRVQKEVTQPVVPLQLNSATRLATGDNPQHDSPLSRGLQALLAYNAAHSNLYTVPADTTKPEEKKEEKKEQVRKSDRQFEAESKDTKEGAPAKTEEVEDEGGFWDQCAVSCMGLIVESMCGVIFGNDSETQAVTPEGTEGAAVTTGPGVQAITTPEAFPYAGAIRPLGESSGEVTVWENPGGDTTGAGIVETLPRGARVTVFEKNEFAYVTWVKVKRIGASEKMGWVRREEVVPAVTTPVASSQPPMIETGPTRDIAESRWQVGVAILYPAFGQRDIRDEYGERAWRLSAESRALLVHSIQIGGSFGYLHSSGEPQFDYVGETTIDSPVKSTLEVWDFGLEMGQLLSFAGGSGFFVYGVGPRAFNVREKADIDVIETGLVIETRTDELSEWKLGGEIELGVGGLAGGRFPIGFQTRFSIIPWESKEEKSLTLDYLKKDAIFAFSFGVTIGVVFF